MLFITDKSVLLAWNYSRLNDKTEDYKFYA
jgi:hypothetical protein